MKVKMILPALTEAKSPFWRPIKYSLFPPLGLATLAGYLDEAHAKGFREVRLIHGRGIGVQREIVRATLARHPKVLSYADAPPGRGGWGATVVRLVE